MPVAHLRENWQNLLQRIKIVVTKCSLTDVYYSLRSRDIQLEASADIDMRRDLVENKPSKLQEVVDG